VVPVSFALDGTRPNTVHLTPAERADVVIDFRNAPDEVFLENIVIQDDGRRPTRIAIPGVPVLKFVVTGPPVEHDATVTAGTPLRPHTAIREDEIVKQDL
jgi:hypothetical protein